MTDYQDVVPDQQSWLEWMVGKIPGYNGYKDKEMRREADSLLRDHIVNQLKEQLTRAEDVSSQMLTGAGLSQLSEMGKGNTRLQTLIDKVKTAAQGYAGFFDAVRVKEDELDALYQFDQNMLMQVGEIGKAIDGVQAALDAGETVPKAVRDYIQAITDMSEKFDTRRNRMVEIA